jgi:hypothetical protein
MLLRIVAIRYIPVKTSTDHQQCRHHLMLGVGNQIKEKVTMFIIN